MKVLEHIIARNGNIEIQKKMAAETFSLAGMKFTFLQICLGVKNRLAIFIRHSRCIFMFYMRLLISLFQAFKILLVKYLYYFFI